MFTASEPRDKATSRFSQEAPEDGTAPTAATDTRQRAYQPVRYAKAACLECGTDYTPRHLEQEFCCAACRKAFNNRAAVRGAELYRVVMDWRVFRKPGSFADVTALIARYRDEDRQAGRTWRVRAFDPSKGQRRRQK